MLRGSAAMTPADNSTAFNWSTSCSHIVEMFPDLVDVNVERYAGDTLRGGLSA